ncbi:BTAD domain-containing putative transcriptional regulator [Micromonospora chaiyaphumensis]|uniref:DNA-binding transcriptional activator of the SARP family n=1 Tax=Micromonospora chaiyaphumensis TaxID=307119 RepID=A0A1C4UVY0_9ACTN|nr:BTAD domain-containing putative transcriptional regulator [Micromonospora chaiyaphumensis]SCE75801.1 DNA-binding transcriptional activator of the SARP family [Micromonospora chaiyaphumensis]
MEIRIRLLGTMELWVNGQQLTPGAAKRRTVLAGLALEANRPVSLPGLAGMVWSDPPSSAVANLRSHAAALRQAVGDRLLARPQAYELRLGSGELDVTDFQRLAEEGRSRLSARDPAGAIDALTGAMAHWRGTAGDGLSRGTLLDNQWATLEEQRLQVFEDLVDAQLAVGAHGDVLPQLRRMLSAHPLRERSWGQLIVALYRRGDVPAALVAYRNARAALRDQLGIEPGEELQRLHRAVLDRSPELSQEAPPARVAVREDVKQRDGRPVPRELPAALGAFVGRTREHAEVLAALSGRVSAAVVVSGAAGSGKTALAVRAAHAVAAHFPDGQVYVDLHYQPSFTGDEVLARVLRALGVDGAAISERACERAGRVRSLLAERRILIVADGVTNAAQVRALVPAGPGSALVVVTQRHLRSLDGVHRVDLDPMPVEDGRALLVALGCAERLAAAPVAAGELLRLCGGSPLALRIVGSRLAARPSATLAALVAELGDPRRRLDLLADDDLSMRQRIDLGFAAVRADDELVGQVLALLAGEPELVLPPEDTAARLGVPAERLWQSLERLLDAHLVCLDASGGYRLPQLVRDYAAELPTMPALHPLPTWRVEPGADPMTAADQPTTAR